MSLPLMGIILSSDNLIIRYKKMNLTQMNLNEMFRYVISMEPADGWESLGARASAGKVIVMFITCVHIGLALIYRWVSARKT